MEILARAVGRRKEAVAQVQMVRGTGQFIINDKLAKEYLHDNLCSLKAIKEPFSALEKTEGVIDTLRTSNNPSIFNFETLDTHVKVKGGGLIGQAEAIKLGIARALCDIESLSIDSNNNEYGISPASQEESLNNVNLSGSIRKQLKTKGFLTQDARVKERRKYGLKKARKASQYHKR
jgi:small subunit ribosomal protein S9